MKQRSIFEIDIARTTYPAFRLPKAYLDRLRAEGTDTLEVLLDDETGILTVRAKIEAGKTGKEKN